MLVYKKVPNTFLYIIDKLRNDKIVVFRVGVSVTGIKYEYDTIKYGGLRGKC